MRKRVNITKDVESRRSIESVTGRLSKPARNTMEHAESKTIQEPPFDEGILVEGTKKGGRKAKGDAETP